MDLALTFGSFGKACINLLSLKRFFFIAKYMEPPKNTIFNM